MAAGRGGAYNLEAAAPADPGAVDQKVLRNHVTSDLDQAAWELGLIIHDLMLCTFCGCGPVIYVHSPACLDLK